MKKAIIGFLILGVFVSGCVQPEKREFSEGNAKLEEIEKKLEVLTPDFARLMPEYSERFYVLHFAGEAEDWAIAKHELHEIEELREIGEAVDPQKGAMLRTFEDAYLKPVDMAIDNENRSEFIEAIEKVPEGCNNCHAAVESPFIRVSLDIPTPLSLRHPHILEKGEISEEDVHEQRHR